MLGYNYSFEFNRILTKVRLCNWVYRIHTYLLTCLLTYLLRQAA